MSKKNSFIVDLSRNSKQSSENDQRLFCSCGAKQKVKAKLRRILIKNSENNYDDKCDFEKIICKSCGQKFDLTKNITTLRVGKTGLLEISFERETLDLGYKKLKILYRVRKHCRYNPEKDDVEEFSVRDQLIYDTRTNAIRLFSQNKNLNFYEETPASQNGYLYFTGNVDDLAKTTYLEFDLSTKDFLKNFFAFSGSATHEKIEFCYEYFMDVLSSSLDRDFLTAQPFFLDFSISRKIIVEKRDGLDCQFVLNRNPFGGEGTIKRKLDIGDYLYKLNKMGHIVFIFISFPPMATLAKMKGLEFVVDSYFSGFFPPIKRLVLNKVTKPQKIIEFCCLNYYNLISLSSLSKTTNTEFKFSSNTLKLIRDYQDALVISKFYIKSDLEKNEIENLLVRYDFGEVVGLMSQVITTANIRDIKLNLKHFHHILKNRIFDDFSNDWLNVYYDTINVLKLIMKIIEESKEKNANKRKLRKLSRFSEQKIFETKNYDKLKELHDEMSAIYRALEDDEKDSLYRNCVKKHKRLNQEHDFFRFTVIPNLKELSQEGLIMRHCIYTYLNDIVKGNYLAINVKDTISREMATLGLKIINGKLHLQQLKGYENSRATELMIGSVLKFCDKNEIIIKGDSVHSTDFQSNEMLEKRMKNYKDKSKSLIIRQKSMEKKQ